MSIVQKILTISEDDYLKGERISEVRHEYVDGAVYAMSGASANHEHIVQNIARHFGNHLIDSSCEPFGSNMMVKVPTGQYRYPDNMVVCDETDNIGNRPIIFWVKTLFSNQLT